MSEPPAKSPRLEWKLSPRCANRSARPRAFASVSVPLIQAIEAYKVPPFLGKLVSEFTVRTSGFCSMDTYQNLVFVTYFGLPGVTVYSMDGTLIRQWGSSGNAPGQFRFPGTIVVTKDGEVVVVDTGHNRVQVFRQDGTLVRTWGLTRGRNNQCGKIHGVALAKIRDLAVTRENKVTLLDVYGRCAYTFRLDGTFLRKCKPEIKRRDTPYEIVIDVAMTTTGEVCEANTQNAFIFVGAQVVAINRIRHRVEVFPDHDAFVQAWCKIGTPRWRWTHTRNVVLRGNEVLVAHALTRSVAVFAREGTLLRTVDVAIEPTELAVTREGRAYVLVGDLNSGRVQVME